MSATRKRSPRSRNRGGAAAGTAAPAEIASTAKGSSGRYIEPKPMPDWKWKTFPVFFALAIGGFVGLYMGIVVQAANNSEVSTFVFVAFALPLGFGFSKLSTRWVLSRRIVKLRKN
ncbi:MAG: hypothetical protein ACRDG3_12830 [Tepidiformaceae bacterium]